MRSVLLQDKLATVQTGIYLGAEAPAVVSSVAEELDFLRSRAAVYDLSWQARIACTGADRVRWLNGMVTNNVRDLAPDRGVYAFALNAQGHSQGDVTIYNRGEYLVVVTDKAQAPRLSEWFDRYVIMDDVELADISEKLAALGVAGPRAAGILQQVGLPIPQEPLQVVDATWGEIGLSVVRGDGPYATYELWAAPGRLPSLWDALTAAGARPLGYQALELFRILSGVPAFGQDIRERDLPQETQQERALHFSKGCYIGQEIVERIRSRGSVHRLFTGFTLSEVVAPGTKLQRDGRDIGEVTSIAQLPEGYTNPIIALGYVRREASAPGAQLAAAGATATVHSLPFEF